MSEPKKRKEKKIKEEKREKIKVKKSKKKKQKTIASLKRKLVTILHLYIRVRDAYWRDGQWWVRCVSCDTEIPFAASQAGHFFPAGTCPSVRFHEFNIHGQCMKCNRYQHGNLILYTMKMISRYDIDFVEMMKEMAFKKHEYGREEILGLIDYYTVRLNELLLRKPVLGDGVAINEESLGKIA